MHKPTPVALAAALLLQAGALHAQQQPAPEQTLATVVVKPSADASAQGLSAPFAGGQVARGGRAGILGTQDNMETPFSITSYTNEFIQDRQARSVGEVLQNDASVRVARGFGNFQESYFIRGFILNSDDIAYNGLYSLLPRQYIATELFERVELLRGASAFLTGATPGGGGIGGAVNLLPKRAPNEPLNRVTVGIASGGQGSVAADIARRFGPDNATGVRVNAAWRDGGTAVDDEKARLGLASVGLDWRSRDVRLSGDLGVQDNRLQRTRPNVTLGGTVTSVPAPPDNSTNFAQPWSFSNERDLFGTFRGEWDLNPATTAWAAYGLRRSKEANSLANLTVTDAASGDGFEQRFDNTRRDRVDTGELGLRGKLRTGGIQHEWVAAASWFRLDLKTAFAFDFGDALGTNLYRPVFLPQPAFTAANTFAGGNLDAPLTTSRTRLASYALGDTLSFAEDRLRLTLGVRHQHLELSDFDATTGARTGRFDAGRISPAVGVVWRSSPAWSFYANAIEGLTRGDTAPASFNGQPVANAGESLPPFVSRQKEVGVKYERGSFGAGLAFFSTSRPRAFVDGAGVFTAGGEDRHDGAELNVFGEPARGLRLLGGLTWLNAIQRSTGSALTDGKRVIGVPRFQGSLGAEWDVPHARGLALDARVVSTGSSFADAANTLRVPGWTRLDLGARYVMEVSGRLVTLRARVDNVTNRDYWASVGGFPGAGYLVVGNPRSVSLSASVEF
jgi:iron complex outermembrane receptor protein